MRILTDLVYLLTAVVISPLVVYRMLRHKRYRRGWPNRFGKISRREPDKKCIWIHAVSVGELNATRTIVGQLKKKFPEFEIVISTTTDTGFARATVLYGTEHQLFYFPLDLSFIVRRAFGRIRPTICLLMELEVWPNFTYTAHKINVPVVVINGRISDRSFSKYKLVRPLVKKVLSNVRLILAQTPQYAQRFIEIGAKADNVIVTGSLKYDTAQITDKIKGAYELAVQLGIDDERLWVAGATGNDEEKLLLDVYQKLKQQERFSDLRLVIVPRKPERFDEVAELIKQAGFEVIRYSQVKSQAAEKSSIPPSPSLRRAGERRVTSDKPRVILGDTMGDLRKFYSLATIIFVGRSLVPMGGSDMIEAAALGKCTIFGPHAFNFKQTVDALLEGNGAIMVRNKQELLEAMQRCLTEPEYSRRIAANGRETIRKNQGATSKTIEAITGLLSS